MKEMMQMSPHISPCSALLIIIWQEEALQRQSETNRMNSTRNRRRTNERNHRESVDTNTTVRSHELQEQVWRCVAADKVLRHMLGQTVRRQRCCDIIMFVMMSARTFQHDVETDLCWLVSLMFGWLFLLLLFLSVHQNHFQVNHIYCSLIRFGSFEGLCLSIWYVSSSALHHLEQFGALDPGNRPPMVQNAADT